jgi:hypothetical protein
MVLQVEKGIERGVPVDNDVSTVSAVPTIWTPLRDKLLAAEAHTAVTTITSSDGYCCYINHMAG